MGEANDPNFEKRGVSVPYAVLTIVYCMLLDVVIYGAILPVMGTFLAGVLCNSLDWNPKVELLLTVLFTFTLIYGVFCLIGEPTYWKHLFAFDKFYCVLLQCRDVLNIMLFILCLISLATAIQDIVTHDRGMKKKHVSAGVIYLFLKKLFEYLHVNPTFLERLGLKPPHKGTIIDPSFGENEKFEHGAAYMLYWAMLTACVAKMVYFNTLYTYLRAMEIFMSMRPVFLNDDDDDTDSSPTLASVVNKGRQSRLENNFARSVRKPTWDDGS